ncbi:MAG: hypothetical protein EHM33_00970 [Chloroflexi bacterium]|nr:MAG: hypothetical protein EHM33_00970 [Chloroflexota bacterium]
MGNTHGADWVQRIPLNAQQVASAGNGGFATAAASLAAAQAGTKIMIDNAAEWDETLTLTQHKVTLEGVGAHNSTRITGLSPAGTGLTVNGAYDVKLENLNISGRSTGAGLKLTGQIRRLHAKDCRFAGGADGVLIEASSGGQVVDVLFENCRFEGTAGVHFTAGGGDPASQIYFKNCDFQYCTGRWVHLDGIHVTGLFLQNCNFLPTEAGAAPATKGITANFTGTTGMISGCNLALTTHASASIELAAGVLYTGNTTEEGVNTARPD